MVARVESNLHYPYTPVTNDRVQIPLCPLFVHSFTISLLDPIPNTSFVYGTAPLRGVLGETFLPSSFPSTETRLRTPSLPRGRCGPLLVPHYKISPISFQATRRRPLTEGTPPSHFSGRTDPTPPVTFLPCHSLTRPGHPTVLLVYTGHPSSLGTLQNLTPSRFWVTQRVPFRVEMLTRLFPRDACVGKVLSLE